VDIIRRSEWGARAPKSRHLIGTPQPKLYLHHAAGANLPGDDGLSDSDLRRIRSIQNFHMDSRGWSDIAYSFLMDPDGYVFEGRGAGVAGGHTAGQNTVSHAICVMGNFDNQAPSDDLLLKIAELVRYGHSKKWWPNQITGGHRDAPDAATSCPGNKLYPKIGEINKRVLEDEDDMTPAEQEALAQRAAELAASKVLAAQISDPTATPGTTRSVAWFLAQGYGGITRAIRAAELAASQTTLAKLALALDADEDVDVVALAAEIKTGLGDEIAQALGRKLVA
jgi:N-acetylmuramoyl-L-alanine amidase